MITIHLNSIAKVDKSNNFSDAPEKTNHDRSFDDHGMQPVQVGQYVSTQ